jgi:hypothetical protein
MEILILGWYNFTATGSVLLLGVCWLKQPEREGAQNVRETWGLMRSFDQIEQ